MTDWRLVCPVSRLSVGGGLTALLDGQPVRVRRAADGSLHAVSGHPGAVRRHAVRVQHGVVEVALRGLVDDGRLPGIASDSLGDEGERAAAAQTVRR